MEWRYPDEDILQEEGFLVCRYVQDVSVTELTNLCALFKFPVDDDRDLTLVVNQTVRPTTKKLNTDATVAQLESIQLWKGYHRNYYVVGVLNSPKLKDEQSVKLKKRKLPPHITLACTDPRRFSVRNALALNAKLENDPLYIRLTGEFCIDLKNGGCCANP